MSTDMVAFMAASESLLPGSDSLLLQVRGGFVQSGTSLRAWCLSHHVDPAHAHRAVRGITNGPAASTLRKQIATAAGVV